MSEFKHTRLDNKSYTQEDIKKLIKENDVKLIQLQFVDINGQVKNMGIPANHIDKALANEIMLDGSSIKGFRSIETSDMFFYPDINSFQILPWSTNPNAKSARLICDIYNPDGTPFEGCPRCNLKRIMKEAEKLGFSMNMGPEAEFFLFEKKDGNIEPELMKNGNAFIQEPVSANLLNATINANLKTKNALDKLSNSNQELARSLYQLNVLYSTSSQFAGTLDKDKLINIMVEGMDKSLSFGLACALTFRNENEPVLIIHSLYNVSERVLEALKLRATLNYKSLFDKKEMPFELDISTLKVEKHIKHSIKEYDFSVLRSDNMFAPILLSENFFGFIEIFREAEFTTEDATCFQTLAQQVSLPLKSANLYEMKEQANKLHLL